MLPLQLSLTVKSNNPENIKSVSVTQAIFYKDMLINSMFLDHIFHFF